MLGSFEIFGKEISWYTLTALIGVLLAGAFAYIKSKKKGLDEISMIYMLMFAFVGVLIGGHLLYGVTNIGKLSFLPQAKTFGDVLMVLVSVFGGQVFYGGLFGGIAAGAVYAKAVKLKDFGGYTDIMAVGVPMFHIFGRMGCFLSGCCYGIESGFGFTFHNALVESANGVNRFPVQLFEAGFNALLAVAMLYLLNKEKFKNRLFMVYMYIYAIGRFILEFFRGDWYRGFLLGLSTSQIISAIIFVLFTVYFSVFYLRKKSVKEIEKTS